VRRESLRLAEGAGRGLHGVTRDGERTARTGGTPGSERNGGVEDNARHAAKHDGHLKLTTRASASSRRFEIGQRLGEVDRNPLALPASWRFILLDRLPRRKRCAPNGNAHDQTPLSFPRPGDPAQIATFRDELGSLGAKVGLARPAQLRTASRFGLVRSSE
jgi:hypothetical protein